MTTKTRPHDRKTDRRVNVAANLRAEDGADGKSRVVHGHAAVFDKLSVPLGGFREKIDPGAFKRAIKEDDVRALWNHDPSLPLARSKAGKGTLELREDKVGLFTEWEMPEGSQGDFWLESIRRGDVTQMSFNFIPTIVEWEYPEEGDAIATVREVELFDVSPVTYPAYEETDIQTRNLRVDRARRDAEGGTTVLDPPADTDEDELEDEPDDDEDQDEIEDDQADDDLDTELEVELADAEAEVQRIKDEMLAAGEDPDAEDESDDE